MKYIITVVLSVIFVSPISALNNDYFTRKRLCGFGDFITIKSRSISSCSAKCARDAVCGGIKYGSGVCRLISVTDIPFLLNLAGISGIMVRKSHTEGKYWSQ